MNPSPDYNECVKTLKLLTFNLYDMNNDMQLCEADLFSLMRSQQDDKYRDGDARDKFFMDVLYNDIMDIKASFRCKQEELNHNDPVYNKQPGKDVKIKETKTFLALKKFQRENRELMLSIFLDKPVPDNSQLIKSVLSDVGNKDMAERER